MPINDQYLWKVMECIDIEKSIYCSKISTISKANLRGSTSWRLTKIATQMPWGCVNSVDRFKSDFISKIDEAPTAAPVWYLKLINIIFEFTFKKLTKFDSCAFHSTYQCNQRAIEPNLKCIHENLQMSCPIVHAQFRILRNLCIH